MTNERMTNDERSPNDEARKLGSHRQGESSKEGNQPPNVVDEENGVFGLRASSLFRYSFAAHASRPLREMNFVIRHSPSASPDVCILAALRSSTDHISRSDLSTQLGVPAADLSGRIAGLQAAGYDIEDHPHLGYRLIAAPDRLIADDLTAML